MNSTGREFDSCDDWWSRLEPKAKMWIHRYFYDQPNPKFFEHQTYVESKETHDFLAVDKRVKCGGSR